MSRAEPSDALSVTIFNGLHALGHCPLCALLCSVMRQVLHCKLYPSPLLPHPCSYSQSLTFYCQPTHAHLGTTHLSAHGAGYEECNALLVLTHRALRHRPPYVLPWSGMRRMSLCKLFRPPLLPPMLQLAFSVNPIRGVSATRAGCYARRLRTLAL
ncbi:hypothetical protein FB451DRAFT_181643 [Mycena latifolia]|nr:hypothetical protein FB451DRAFT_181643 [Mycena latifolia]